MRRGGGLRTALMAVGAVLLVVILGWYALVLRPRAGDISEAQEQLEQAEGELQSLQATLQQLETIDDDRPELEAELRQLTAAVPPQPELGTMILALHDLAGRSDLAFLGVTPALPSAQEGLAATAIALTLQVEGDFFSVVDFFDRLEDLERIVVVDSISLAASEPEPATGGGDGAASSTARVPSGADVVTLQNGDGAEAIAVTTDAATAGQAPAPGTTVSTTAERSGTQFQATLLERGGVIRIPSFVIAVSVQARMFTTAPPAAGEEGAAGGEAPAPDSGEGAQGEEGPETTTTTVAAEGSAAATPATTTTTVARRTG